MIDYSKGSEMDTSAQHNVSRPGQFSIHGTRLLYIIHSQRTDVKRLTQVEVLSITLRKATIPTQNLLHFTHI
jgi:hypothetical protein